MRSQDRRSLRCARARDAQSLVCLQVVPLEGKRLSRARATAAKQPEDDFVPTIERVFQPLHVLERNRVRLAFASMWQSQSFCGILRDEFLFDRFRETATSGAAHEHVRAERKQAALRDRAALLASARAVASEAMVTPGALQKRSGSVRKSPSSVVCASMLNLAASSSRH